MIAIDLIVLIAPPISKATMLMAPTAMHHVIRIAKAGSPSFSSFLVVIKDTAYVADDIVVVIKKYTDIRNIIKRILPPGTEEITSITAADNPFS